MGYAEVAVEMNIIFMYIEPDLVAKIPQKMKDFFKAIASPTYVAHIDPRFPLDEQPLLRETEILLTVLFRQYWATKDEKQEIDDLIKENDKKLNDRYSVENIFKQVEEIKSIEDAKETSLTVINEDSFVYKFKNICRKIWSKLFNLDNQNTDDDNFNNHHDNDMD
ncbi:MAG: hypothetical protein HFJ46_04730 [Clostridia bacterium]|nr:hypothetical protein [Clostridia bacterium]